MTKWHERYLRLAATVAGWSKDPERRVGAVATDRQNRVVGLGYNGFPAGVPDCSRLIEDRQEKLLRTVHAEVNALQGAREPVALYVWPCLPCARCAGEIIAAGVMYVITMTALAEPTSHWWQDWIATTEMFRLAGVGLVTYDTIPGMAETRPTPCGRCSACKLAARGV